MTSPTPRISKEDAAAVLGREFNDGGKAFTTRTINNWMRLGMPHFKVGDRVTFDAAAIVRWADRRFTRGDQSCVTAQPSPVPFFSPATASANPSQASHESAHKVYGVKC